MRRFALYAALVTAVLAGTSLALTRQCAADDQQIAQQIAAKLREHQQAGRLKGFDIDLNVENGKVTLIGNVVDEQQHQIAIDSARFVPGVQVVINDLKIQGQKHEHPEQQPTGGTSAGGAGLGNLLNRPAAFAQPEPAASQGPATGPAGLAPGESRGLFADLRNRAARSNSQFDEVVPPQASEQSAVAPASAAVDQQRHVQNAVATAATSQVPVDAKAADHEIAAVVVQKLRDLQQSGELVDFEIDVKVTNGRVSLMGNVSDQWQHQLAIDAVRFVPGVKVVVNDLKIQGEKFQHPAQQPTAPAPQLAGVPRPAQSIMLPPSSAPQPPPLSVVPFVKIERDNSSQATQVAAATPAQPAAQPAAEPIAQPTQPIAQPTELAAQPTQQVVQQTQPVAQPAQPVAQIALAAQPQPEVAKLQPESPQPQAVAARPQPEMVQQQESIAKPQLVASNPVANIEPTAQSEHNFAWQPRAVAYQHQPTVEVAPMREQHFAQTLPAPSDEAVAPPLPTLPQAIEQPYAGPVASEIAAAPQFQPQVAQLTTPQASQFGPQGQFVARPQPVAYPAMYPAMQMQMVPAMGPQPGYGQMAMAPAMRPASGQPMRQPAMRPMMVAAAPIRLVQAVQPQQMQPAPQFIQGTGQGVIPARYDHPQMPAYAWPSYASYPNYAALQYPKQYSAHAWPYIGPFYPYPQVPLGWRKVTLTWDDGWWMLDFKDKGYGPYVTR